jgi:hypothetical protein
MAGDRELGDPPLRADDVDVFGRAQRPGANDSALHDDELSTVVCVRASARAGEYRGVSRHNRWFEAIDTIDPSYDTLDMAMGKRKRDRQPMMWVPTTELPTAASHPLYRRVNQVLREHRFDDFVEGQCAGFTPTPWAVQACRPVSISDCC